MPEEALLVEDGMPVPPGRAAAAHFALPAAGHPAGCSCCGPRHPAAAALGQLFLDRARGQVPFFRAVRVVATGPGRDAVAEALRSDPLAAARFRAGG